MADTEEKKPRKTFIVSLMADTILDAIVKLDGMKQSFYDMTIIDMEVLGDGETVVIKVFGWENYESREYLSC